ncbi:MAG: glycosyltransferase family 2 protein [Pseudomonadota bacterium]
MSNKPVITAVMVTYHTGPRLRDSLNALVFDPQVSEIVIVDNGNPEADQAWLDGFAGGHATRVKLVRPRENLGFGRACNLGAREARGNLLLFINPDAVMKRGSVKAMVEASAGKPVPWLVGGKIFGPDGREQRGARRRELTLMRALGLSRWTLEKLPEPDSPIPVDAISGAFFMMAKQQFLMLDGGFDGAYFLHVEDIDLCRRVREAGGTVIYQPAAGALHYGSTSGMPSAEVASLKADSLTYYFRKFARSPLAKLANLAVLPAMAWAVKRRSS